MNGMGVSERSKREFEGIHMTGLARAGGAELVVYCVTAHWQSKLRRRGSGDIRKSQSPYEKLQTITQKRTNNHKQRKKKKEKKRKTPIKRHYINPSNELFFPINFAFSSCWYPSPISQWPRSLRSKTCCCSLHYR